MSSPKQTPAKPFSFLAETLIAELRGVPFEVSYRRKLRATQPAGDLVGSLMEKYGIGMDTPENVIRDHWKELVGPANAHYSHAATLDERGQLIVLIKHSVVRNEMFMHRATILKRIQALPGCSKVRSLHLRAG